MQELKVTPLPGACGAEIGGIDLARPLADATIDAIRVAFVEHYVLFFANSISTPRSRSRSVPVSVDWKIIRSLRHSPNTPRSSR